MKTPSTRRGGGAPPIRQGRDRVAGIIGARLYTDAKGFSTDSTALYEVCALADHFDHFYLHVFIVPSAAGRDPVMLPESVTTVSLGRITDGKALLRECIRTYRSLSSSAASGAWGSAVIFETGLVQILSLLACARHHRRVIAAIRGDSASTARMAERAGLGSRAKRWSLVAVHWASQRLFSATVPMVVDSPDMAAKIERWGGQACVVPAGSISAGAFHGRDDTWPGPHARPLRLLWVGRMVKVKALEQLLAAFARVLRTGRRVELDLIGSGSPAYEAMLRDMAHRLSVDAQVRFVGTLPHGAELVSRYRDNDVFVLPSLSEGTPKVIGEAFAAGLPVLASNVGNIPDLLSSGGGILIEAGNVEDLAEAIIRLYDAPWTIEQMSRQAREKAFELSIDSTTARLADATSLALVPSLRTAATRLGVRIWSR